MRSALTMLGIVIGVASVITLIAVGTGSQAAVQASIARLGSNTLYVLPMPTGTGGHGSALQQRLRKLLGISSKPDNSTHDMLPQLRQWKPIAGVAPEPQAGVEHQPSRASYLASTLSASLELVKEGALEARQVEAFSDLYLRSRPRLEAERP